MKSFFTSKKFLLSAITVFCCVIPIGVYILFTLLNPVIDFKSDTVKFENGIQTIGLKAGLGYSPNKILARSNVPTKLEVQTNNTYDCTAFMNIPKLNLKKFLPPNGITEIEIPSQNPGEVIEGFCGADTYKFVIKFANSI